MYAVSTNQIADILHFNNIYIYIYILLFFGYLYFFQRNMPTKACMIYFYIKR